MKTSSTRLQRNNYLSSKTSWRHLARRLEGVLGDEKLLRWRRLEDVLKTCLDDILKTCLEEVFKTSWRQAKYLLEISLSNKSKPVSDKSISHMSISDKSRRIQTALIRTHSFQYSSYLQNHAEFLPWELKSLTTV